MKITARFILVFGLLSLVFGLLFTIHASAQANPYTVPNTNPDVPKNLHTWTQNVMIEVMSAMSCQLTGIDPTNPKSQCLGVDTKTGNIGYVQGGGGAIGVAGKMIGMLYTPPLHSGDYFKYLASNFGIAKNAYAATGFEGLKPVQSLWVAFRNIVYLLFVVVFVVIGLAIMFRVRIDPRTVMTIQNQIPKIIIGILLVTFSFAIAGFLIDLMYVVIFLSYELISGAVPTIKFDALNPLNLQNATPFTAAQGVTGGLLGLAKDGALAVFSIVNSLLSEIVTIKVKAVLAVLSTIVFLINPLYGLLGLVLRVNGANIASGIISFIAFFIIAIALLITLIRLWFTLIMAYVGILLDVVFAPFWIAAGLLPGVPAGFGGWARSIIANLAAFPATILMFLLAKAFIDGFGAKPAPTDFVPPLIGDFAGTDKIGAIVALGIIFMTPNVVNMVKAAIKAPKLPTGAAFAPIVAAAGVPIAGGRAVAASFVKTQAIGQRQGVTGAFRQIFKF